LCRGEGEGKGGCLSHTYHHHARPVLCQFRGSLSVNGFHVRPRTATGLCELHPRFASPPRPPPVPLLYPSPLHTPPPFTTGSGTTYCFQQAVVLQLLTLSFRERTVGKCTLEGCPRVTLNVREERYMDGPLHDLLFPLLP
jgi:hypothetical protein